MAEPHPACPLDPESDAWQLLRGGAEPLSGSGLAEGLRKLWRATVQNAIDANGNDTGASPVLVLAARGQKLGARGQVAIRVEPRGNSVLLRLRAWLDGAQGQVLLSRIAQTHAGLLLASERWSQPDPAPDAESLALLTLAGVMDESETFARALKPGH